MKKKEKRKNFKLIFILTILPLFCSNLYASKVVLTLSDKKALVQKTFVEAEDLIKKDKIKKAAHLLEEIVPEARAALDEQLLEQLYLKLVEVYSLLKNKKKVEEYDNLYTFLKTKREKLELEKKNLQKEALLKKVKQEKKIAEENVKKTENVLIEVNKTLHNVRDSLTYMELLNREKEAKILVLKQEKEIEDLKLKEQEYLLKQQQLTIKEQEALAKLEYTIILSLAVGIVILIILAVVIYINFRQKKKYSEQIEGQLKIIQKQHENIRNSINYAQRIQTAILPAEESVGTFIPESFILFKPKDVVSGDFYWVHDVNSTLVGRPDGKKVLIAAVDCTGHGVPGAFMSMIGCNLLNEIASRKIYEPDQVLYELNQSICKTLKQDETNVQDGMDMALCLIDKERNVVEFAGAKNPILVIRENQMEVIKGDKNPIGGTAGNKERYYKKNIIPISGPTTIYFFSDGYEDQFGGPENKKFMNKNLRELLFSIHDKPFQVQKTILENTLEDWKGNKHTQIDDILVMGLKVA